MLKVRKTGRRKGGRKQGKKERHKGRKDGKEEGNSLLEKRYFHFPSQSKTDTRHWLELPNLSLGEGRTELKESASSSKLLITFSWPVTSALELAWSCLKST